MLTGATRGGSGRRISPRRVPHLSVSRVRVLPFARPLAHDRCHHERGFPRRKSWTSGAFAALQSRDRGICFSSRRLPGGIFSFVAQVVPGVSRAESHLAANVYLPAAEVYPQDERPPCNKVELRGVKEVILSLRRFTKSGRPEAFHSNRSHQFHSHNLLPHLPIPRSVFHRPIVIHIVPC